MLCTEKGWNGAGGRAEGGARGLGSVRAALFV